MTVTDYEVAGAATLLAWLAYLAIFAWMFATRKRFERSRDWSLWIGILFQGAGSAVIPQTYRPYNATLIPANWAYAGLLEHLVCLAAILMQFGAVWMTFSAIRTLGKQWSLSARTVEGHQLVRSGPYGVVRHPIYTAVVGMNVGATLAVCTWNGVVLALVCSVLGSMIRVHSEERLMRDTFGAEYTRYARSVPALIPWFRFRRESASST